MKMPDFHKEAKVIIDMWANFTYCARNGVALAWQLFAALL